MGTVPDDSQIANRPEAEAAIRHLRALPRAPERTRYALAELEQRTGVNGRTIRYYITQGLLPPAHGRGPSATYDAGHLHRLLLIQLLKAEHLPLREIKERLSVLTDADVAALVEVQEQPPEGIWRRVILHPDIELHVRYRQPTDAAFERTVDLIIGMAGPLIERMERDGAER